MEYTNPKMGRNELCWCGSGKKYKKCHMDFDLKIDEYEERGYEVPERAIIKTPEEIAGIKESAKINIAALDAVVEKIHPGMATIEIDDLVYDVVTKAGAIPADLNYEGYPKSVCTSVNNEVCHGIPSEDVILKDGDIVNVDMSTIYKGYYSDSSRMFMIGDVSEENQKLVRVAKECVDLGVKAVKPWKTLGDMGDVVHRHAVENGYSVVWEFGGHGCGCEFHEDPFVSYVSKPGEEMLMVPGMCFTIEPMINLGRPEIKVDEKNGWTVYTRDGSMSAQWEVQVLVTEDGCEVLAY
ncbi:MAG: methionyl aminopeptidase [Eubacterium sp.]